MFWLIAKLTNFKLHPSDDKYVQVRNQLPNLRTSLRATGLGKMWECCRLQCRHHRWKHFTPWLTNLHRRCSPSHTRDALQVICLYSLCKTALDFFSWCACCCASVCSYPITLLKIAFSIFSLQNLPCSTILQWECKQRTSNRQRWTTRIWHRVSPSETGIQRIQCEKDKGCLHSQ